jgi:hypothetical protein
MKTYVLIFDDGRHADWNRGDHATEALDNHYNSLEQFGTFPWQDDWPIETGKVAAYEVSVSDEELECWSEMDSEERMDKLTAYVAAHPELRRTELTVTFSSKGREIL